MCLIESRGPVATPASRLYSPCGAPAVTGTIIGLVRVSAFHAAARTWSPEPEKLMATRKIGRDAKNGQFIPVKEAQDRKSTATVETIKTKGR
jgi:hypothetical protein